MSAFVHHSHKLQHFPNLHEGCSSPVKVQVHLFIHACSAQACLTRPHREMIRQIYKRTNCNNKIFIAMPGKRICQLSEVGHLERNVIYCLEIYSQGKKLIITPLVKWNPNRRRAKIHLGRDPELKLKFLKRLFLSKLCSPKPEIRLNINACRDFSGQCRYARHPSFRSEM